LNTINQKDI